MSAASSRYPFHHTYTDEQLEHNGNHSKRADVSVFSRENVVAKAHERYGLAVMALETLNGQLEAAFKRLDEATAQMEAVHVRAQPVLPPLLDAAWGVHTAGVKDTRLEQASVTPPPLPPVEAE